MFISICLCLIHYCDFQYQANNLSCYKYEAFQLISHYASIYSIILPCRKFIKCSQPYILKSGIFVFLTFSIKIKWVCP